MNKILMILLVVLVYSTADAQSQFEPTENLVNGSVKWGVKAGWNCNNLYGKDLNYVFSSRHTDIKSGLHAGIFVETRMFRNLGLKHELLFVQKSIGVSLAYVENEVYGAKLNTSYLELTPASLIFYVGRFQLNAGPYVSSLLGANVNRRDKDGRLVKDRSIFGIPENDESEKRYLQKFDFGATIGVSYTFDSGLLIGTQYSHGLTDIFQYANSYTNEDTKTSNIKIGSKGLMLSIGYVLK